jgi:cytochrome c553
MNHRTSIYWFHSLALSLFSLSMQSVVLAGETNGVPHSSPLTQAMLADSMTVWDADSKTTNVASGLDFARFSFAFTNVSAGPLIVINVHTSCGCTTAQLPPLPWTVPAGTNGQIGVRVNLAGKSGTVTKTVTVGTDQGTKTLLVKIIIEPPTNAVMTDAIRIKNMELAQANRQAVLGGDCASCHIKSIEGKYGKQLYDSVCGVCHEAAHRATMVPDLHTLTVPTDEYFWRTWISYGRLGSLMPAFAKIGNGPLTDLQIVSLAAYLNVAIPSHITNSVP